MPSWVSSPAFVLADGGASDALLKAAGMMLLDSEGNAVATHTLSWRACSVHSAKEAGFSVVLFLDFGRWFFPMFLPHMLFGKGLRAGCGRRFAPPASARFRWGLSHRLGCLKIPSDRPSGGWGRYLLVECLL